MARKEKIDDNLLLKTDLKEFIEGLRDTYDKCEKGANRIYAAVNNRSAISFEDAKQVTSKDVPWTNYMHTDPIRQGLINTIVNSGNDTIYGIAIASLAKKIDDPDQNILVYSDDPAMMGKRLSQDGYPLNDFGKRLIHPFLRDNDFLESRVTGGSEFLPSNFRYRLPGRIWSADFPSTARPEAAFRSLMYLLHDIQNEGADPRQYLESFFTRSIYKKIEIENSKVETRTDMLIARSRTRRIIKEHLDFKYTDTVNASVLPVLATWSACKCRIEEENPDAILEMYNPHHATDSPESPGDIIVRNRNGFMDAIDVKGHGRKLTSDYVRESYNKKIREATEKHNLRTYYYIYCDEPDSDEKRKIENFADRVQDECGCDIRLISMDNFLKHGLPRDCSQFIGTYNHEIDENRYNELQPEHVEKLGGILKREGLAVDSQKEEKEAGSISVRESLSRIDDMDMER